MVTVPVGKCDSYLFTAFCCWRGWLVVRFYDVSFLVSNLWSLHTCYLVYQEQTLYQNGIINSLKNKGQNLYTFWCSCAHKIWLVTPTLIKA